MALYPEKILLKLPVGTKDRISGRSDNSQEFIRAAIEVALRDIGDRVPGSSRVVEKSPASDDVSVLLSALESPMTERDLATELDWMPGRVTKAVRDAGRRVRSLGGGMMVAV